MESISVPLGLPLSQSVLPGRLWRHRRGTQPDPVGRTGTPLLGQSWDGSARLQIRWHTRELSLGDAMRSRRFLVRFAALILLVAAPLQVVGASGASASVNHGGVITAYGIGIDGPEGITSGPDGALWFTNASGHSIGRITGSGVVTNFDGAEINHPKGITVGPDGALWFTNRGNNSIGRITTSGVVTNYTSTDIGGPWDITAGPDGALWFTNFGQEVHRKDHHLGPSDRLHSAWHRQSYRDHLGS